MQTLPTLAQIDQAKIAQELIHELLSPAPRALYAIQAELLMMRDGTYLFHYRDPKTGAESFKPVSPQTLQSAFSDRLTDSGWLNPSIVRWGISSREFAVQWIAPHTVSIQIETEHIKVALPGLVWIGYGTEYWVIATQTKTFSPQANAFHAPLANIHPETHQVCWGDITPPETLAIDVAWRKFITSQFNQDWSRGKSIRHPQNINDQLRSLRSNRYPLKDLVLIREGVSTHAAPKSVETVIHTLLPCLATQNDR
jgi:hypothetical protein